MWRIRYYRVGLVLSLISLLIAGTIAALGFTMNYSALDSYPQTDSWTYTLRTCCYAVSLSMAIVLVLYGIAFVIRNPVFYIVTAIIAVIEMILVIICGSILFVNDKRETWCEQLIPQLTFLNNTNVIQPIICQDLPNRAISAGALSFLLLALLIVKVIFSFMAEPPQEQLSRKQLQIASQTSPTMYTPAIPAPITEAVPAPTPLTTPAPTPLTTPAPMPAAPQIFVNINNSSQQSEPVTKDTTTPQFQWQPALE